jgi:hypothetical protein
MRMTGDSGGTGIDMRTTPPKKGLIAFGSRSAALLATIAACALAAGCGSSSPKRTTGSPSVAAQQLAFSRCVRAHGVASFPDPGASVSGQENIIGGIAIPTTINIQSPAFKTAWTACQGLMAARLAPEGKPPITASLKASLIAHAQCMRTHGVPGYQDPRFPAGGGIEVTDAGTNPQAPAYRNAAALGGHR